MTKVSDAKNDIKDIRVAGCRVKLCFQSMERGKWIVQCAVTCGVDENSSEQSFSTISYPTRDEAEREALRQATNLLGNNVDRSTNRVTNTPPS